MKSKITIAAVIVGVVIVFLLRNCAEYGRFSSTSPHETYQIRITGNRFREHIPFLTQSINFDLHKTNGPDVLDRNLITFGGFDPDFERQYPNHIWASENVLQFGTEEAKTLGNPDSLTVSNNTDSEINYLIIRALDLFLVLDIPPRATFDLKVPHGKWQSWITGTGEFADGRPITWQGVNFLHRDRLKEPTRYCLTIEENKLTINSPVIEGWNSENPNIVKAACK